MRKALPTIAIVAVAAFLQAAFAPYMAIGGVVPNFLLLAVVTIALVEGPIAGCSVGFVAGAIFDLLGSGPVGPMILVLTVTGYLAGQLHANMFAEGWLLPMTVLAIAALGSELAYGLIIMLLGAGGPFVTMLFSKMLPSAVYNTALGLLVYPWLARILRPDRPTMRTFHRLA
jgi:rod shape-determining protein MreD